MYNYQKTDGGIKCAESTMHHHSFRNEKNTLRESHQGKSIQYTHPPPIVKNGTAACIPRYGYVQHPFFGQSRGTSDIFFVICQNAKRAKMAGHVKYRWGPQYTPNFPHKNRLRASSNV